MKKLVLTHPSLGHIDEMNITGKYFKSRIIQIWRWRYGKQIDKCDIDEVPVVDRSVQPVINEYTGDVYTSMVEVQNVYGICWNTLRNQLDGIKTPRTKVKFKRA